MKGGLKVWSVRGPLFRVELENGYTYDVRMKARGPVCSCGTPDCAHVAAVLALKASEPSGNIIFPLDEEQVGDLLCGSYGEPPKQQPLYPKNETEIERRRREAYATAKAIAIVAVETWKAELEAGRRTTDTRDALWYAVQWAIEGTEYEQAQNWIEAADRFYRAQDAMARVLNPPSSVAEPVDPPTSDGGAQ